MAGLTRSRRAPGTSSRKARFTWAALLGLASLCSPVAARAEEPPRLRALSYDLRIDLPVMVAAAGGFIALDRAAGSLAGTCRWCESNGLDDAFRSAFRRNDPKPARVTSDVFAIAAPFVAVGLGAIVAADEGRVSDTGVNALVVGEATSVAMLLNSIAKVSFARERPFVHALPEDQKASTPSPGDNNVSFFSGHATWTFALATSAGTVASMRGYRLAPVVWSVGLMLATSTSYLRMAGDKHYFTDVLGGALVGSAVGVALPLIFHRPVSKHVTVSAYPISGGQMFTLTMPSPI